MKTPINLETTKFEFASVARAVPSTCVFIKNILTKVPDFGTIFIGLDKITNTTFLEEIEDAAIGNGPVFTAPEHWGWAQIARSLGMFASATQARKNGWDGTPEPGFNSRLARINKIKGELLVVHITDNSSWVTDKE